MAALRDDGHLITLVYVSAAVHLLSDHEIIDILRVSQRNNKRACITGVLLYEGGNFIQVLEGPEGSVRELESRIKSDPRHSGYLQLLMKTSTERHFAHWSMGFKRMSDLSVEDRAVFNAYLEDRREWPQSGDEETSNTASKRATAALTLLKSFKHSCGFLPEPSVSQSS